MRILIFGGTGEAVDLANELVRQGHQVTTSLAGVTRKPRRPNGHIHTGGFGGVDGLFDYMSRNGFQYLIDATHPFAAQISANIVAAAERAGLPMLRLLRPAWEPRSGDNWHNVPDLNSAASLLGDGARALITVGRQHIEPFILCDSCQIYVRAIEHPEIILPHNVTVILERPPFRLADELAFMRDKEITHLVTKNAGGSQTAAKLEAARMLGIKVIMIARPTLPDASEVFDVEEVLRAVSDHSAAVA